MRVEALGCPCELIGRITQMLERVPEDDRGEAAVDLADLGRAHVRSIRCSLESEHLASAGREGIEQGTVAGADVEHGTGWCDPVDAAREPAAGAAQDRVAEAKEAPGRWPVPLVIGRLELGVGRPGVGRGDSTSATTLAARKSFGRRVERDTAPRAVRRGVSGIDRLMKRNLHSYEARM